jgi:CheY-like chemotaxis protein
MRSVLIVEDEPQIRQLVGIVLEAAGYTVLEAGNGMDALDMMRKRFEPLDMIILDLRMPKMDGFEFLYRLKRHERSSTPVLVLTAHEESFGKARDFGADACISKPFDRKQLLEIANHLIAAQAA